MGRKKREPNFIICDACKKIFDKATRSNFCAECRDSERKKLLAEKERQRRIAKKDEINEKRRLEYVTNPKRKEMCNNASKKSYQKYMNDPELKKDLNERARVSMMKHRFEHIYNGNGKIALERDSFKCTRCSSKTKLNIHHIDGNGSTHLEELQNNELSNLITLCASCHAREHRLNEKNGKTSKYVGVWKSKDIWQSQIRHNSKVYYLGRFDTEEEAFEAYQSKKKELKIN